jgi:hypothetical protein
MIAAPAAEPADLSIEMGELPAEWARPEHAGRIRFESPADGGEARLVLLESDGEWLFRYSDGTRFVVARDGRRVWGTWDDALTLEDACAYLLGPVLAFVLRLQGRLSLHAAVFEADGGAVALAGGPEAGKSTLLASLALGGARILSDDLASLAERAGRIWVHPSYPRIRLWEDSTRALFGAADALPRLTPNWEKRFFDVTDRFQASALPLRAVFVIAERERASAAPRVERLTPRAALVEMLAQLHSVWMLPDLPQHDVFDTAQRIVRDVPVLRLVPHADPGRTDELRALVLGATERLAEDSVGREGGRRVSAP